MLATVISDILFRMGKRRERMRTGRVVASLVSGHPPFAPFEFVMDAITYIPLAPASCSGSKWGAMVAWRNLSESIRFRIGYWTIYERWISIFIHRAAAIKTLSFPFTLGKGSPLCIRVYNDDVILQIMHNISSYIGGKEEEESVTAYFQPSIIPPGHSAYIFPSIR